MGPVELLLSILAFVWGSVWGSFANVAIYRLPLGESVLTPPSHCPHCKQRLRWFQNIPILSYIFLGGRCGFCRKTISIRYPLVELTTAALSLAVWLMVANNPFIPTLSLALAVYLFWFFFVLALVIITFIDLEHKIIPNVISLPFIVIGLGFHGVFGEYTGLSIVEVLIGAVAGAGVIELFILGYYLLTKQEGMGRGDTKLMAMLGAFLGWKALLFVLLGGSIQGLFYSIPAYFTGEKDVSYRKLELPFGPFLSLAALEWLFFSPWIAHWFQTLFAL